MVRTRTTRSPGLLRLPRPGARVVAGPLRAVGVLSACTPQDLQHLTRVGDIVVADGGMTVQPVSLSGWVYVVLEGMLAVTSDDVMYLVEGGDVVGARAALRGRHPLVGIQSLVPCRFYVISVRAFLALMHQRPGVAFGVARHLADDDGMA